jgi:hypothetical protein
MIIDTTHPLRNYAKVYDEAGNSVRSAISFDTDTGLIQKYKLRENGRVLTERVEAVEEVTRTEEGLVVDVVEVPVIRFRPVVEIVKGTLRFEDVPEDLSPPDPAGLLMPAFNFKCRACGPFRKLLDRSAKAHPCPKCSSPARRDPKPPTSNVTETLDNGIMARRVERIQGATEIYSERARQDREKGRREIVVTTGTGIKTTGG